MTIKDLIKDLGPDWKDYKIRIVGLTGDDFKTYSIHDIADIGYSDKVVKLSVIVDGL